MSKFDDAVAATIEQGSVSTANVESQKLRSMAQGLAMGWYDELEAAVRVLAREGRPYEEIRDEIRAKVSAYQQANPGEALTFEALGVVAPTAAAFLIPGGQAAGAARAGSLADFL